MKKLIVVLSILMMLTACGTKESAKILDIEGFTSAVTEKMKQEDELVKLSEEKSKDFYDVSFEGLEEYSISISATRATSDEICIMKVSTDNKDAKIKAKEAINKRIEEQKSSYELYIPSEYEKLQNATVIEEGDYIIFVCGLDSEAVISLIKENQK